MRLDQGMRPSGPHVCPSCEERVSAFAAGCALCGADLDPRRGQKPLTIGERLRRLRCALPGLRRNSSLVRR